ncbi:zinc ribbon domain-containing protein [Lawsonibacter sp. JLR.KK007]|jgi:hypothetical protein|uniref:zinc ribbon domain-containing protein n=1 Tax=Lawsonibacter sp. JLR.KK007 TaxID=3114293 RepID=UPI002FEF9B70
MNDNEKKSGDWKLIVGGILLIIVLFIAINFIFWGLGQMVPRQNVDVSQSASASLDVSGEQDAPSFCIHCGKALPDSFQWGQFCPYCGEKVE